MKRFEGSDDIIMDKKSIRAVLLIISTFTYLLFGAAIFEKLESPDDMERRQEIRIISKKMQQKYNFTKFVLTMNLKILYL